MNNHQGDPIIGVNEELQVVLEGYSQGRHVVLDRIGWLSNDIANAYDPKQDLIRFRDLIAFVLANWRLLFNNDMDSLPRAFKIIKCQMIDFIKHITSYCGEYPNFHIQLQKDFVQEVTLLFDKLTELEVSMLVGSLEKLFEPYNYSDEVFAEIEKDIRNQNSGWTREFYNKIGALKSELDKAA